MAIAKIHTLEKRIFSMSNALDLDDALVSNPGISAWKLTVRAFWLPDSAKHFAFEDVFRIRRDWNAV